MQIMNLIISMRIVRISIMRIRLLLSEWRETYLLFAVQFSCDARIYILLSLNILRRMFRRNQFRDLCCPLSEP